VKNGEKVHEYGILEEFKLSEENATSLIMQARVKAGWIDESDLVVPEEDIKEEVLAASSELTAEDVFG
jgi:N utilization substance protein A